MTRVPSHGQGALRATLSRLLLVVALVLFGAPQSLADEALSHAGRTAESQIQPSDGLLTGQPQQLRAPVSDDTAQDVLVPCSPFQRDLLLLTALAPAFCLPPAPFTLSILPSVRGPPAI